jgi:hypothetical protein
MDKVLINTDIIIDYFFDRQPSAEYAPQVSGLCKSIHIKSFVKPVICSNVYYLLRLAAINVQMKENLKQLLMIFNVFLMDNKVVSSALNSGFKDFEESFQNFAVMNNGEIPLIFTQKLKEFNKSENWFLTL